MRSFIFSPDLTTSSSSNSILEITMRRGFSNEIHIVKPFSHYKLVRLNKFSLKPKGRKQSQNRTSTKSHIHWQIICTTLLYIERDSNWAEETRKVEKKKFIEKQTKNKNVRILLHRQTQYNIVTNFRVCPRLTNAKLL